MEKASKREDCNEKVAAFCKLFLGTFLVSVCGYFLAYLLLMDRRNPVLDDDGTLLFHSSFRFGELRTIRGNNGHIFSTIERTGWNYFFYPLDRFDQTWGGEDVRNLMK